MKNILTSLKPPSSYTKQVKNAIKLVSVDKNNSFPFGTYIYRASPYPSDIDVIEIVNECCSPEDAGTKLSIELQNIVNNLINTPFVYVPEIKAGIDYRYKINLGEYKKNKLVGFDKKHVIDEVNILYNNKLLDKEEYEHINSLIDDAQHDRTKWEELYDFIREMWLLRWDTEEVLHGYKMLRGNFKKLLKDAVIELSPVKIDTWQIINGKFTEVTNFYILSYIDKKGEEHLLNFPRDYRGNLVMNLKKEVEKFYYSKKFFKPLKMAKRIWSIARLTKDMNTIKKLTPILRSDGALVGQVISDISMIVDMLKRIGSPPLKILNPQIDNLKQKLIYNLEIPLNVELNDRLIDMAVNTDDVQKKINYLKELKKELEYLNNKYIVNYLKKIKMYPPTKFFYD